VADVLLAGGSSRAVLASARLSCEFWGPVKLLISTYFTGELTQRDPQEVREEEGKKDPKLEFKYHLD